MDKVTLKKISELILKLNDNADRRQTMLDSLWTLEEENKKLRSKLLGLLKGHL